MNITQAPTATTPCIICDHPTTPTDGQPGQIGDKTGTMCPDCQYWCDGNLTGEPTSPEGEAFHTAEQARGPLAYAPDTMTCYECGGFNGVSGPERAVVALAGVTGGSDPSQMYRLECGHEVIAA